MTSAHRPQVHQLLVRDFISSKSGHDIRECEDAIGINKDALRFALADGATEAFDSLSWAKRLTNEWVQSDATLTPEDFWEWLTEQGRVLRESWQDLKLSWYAEEKARSGSFAAFVGVQLELQPSSSSWTGIALGDSCVFHFRGWKLLSTLPEMNASSFTASPILAPSDTSPQSTAKEKVVVSHAKLDPGDTLFLCSDAIAAWVLGDIKNGKLESLDLEFLFDSSANELASFFELQRSRGTLKDDDISIVLLKVQSTP